MNQYQTLLAHLPPAMLVIFRIGGLMIYGPVFGSPVIPMRIKVFLSFIIGLAVYPLLSAAHFVGPDFTHLSLWTLGPVIGLELVIGLVIGYAASIPLLAAQTGGLVSGQQMGLGFARFYNPSMGADASIIGQLLWFMVFASFLAMGGHEAMLTAVLHSFQYVPAGASVIDGDLIALLTGLLLAAFELALRVAAPVLAIIFLQSVAMGFMAKTIPQLNILSLGFPLRILVGFAIIMFGLVIINEVVMDDVGAMLDQLFLWVQSR